MTYLNNKLITINVSSIHALPPVNIQIRVTLPNHFLIKNSIRTFIKIKAQQQPLLTSSSSSEVGIQDAKNNFKDSFDKN